MSSAVNGGGVITFSTFPSSSVCVSSSRLLVNSGGVVVVTVVSCSGVETALSMSMLCVQRR